MDTDAAVIEHLLQRLSYVLLINVFRFHLLGDVVSDVLSVVVVQLFDVVIENLCDLHHLLEVIVGSRFLDELLSRLLDDLVSFSELVESLVLLEVVDDLLDRVELVLVDDELVADERYDPVAARDGNVVPLLACFLREL